MRINYSYTNHLIYLYLRGSKDGRIINKINDLVTYADPSLSISFGDFIKSQLNCKVIDQSYSALLNCSIFLINSIQKNEFTLLDNRTRNSFLELYWVFTKIITTVSIYFYYKYSCEIYVDVPKIISNIDNGNTVFNIENFQKSDLNNKDLMSILTNLLTCTSILDDLEIDVLNPYIQDKLYRCQWVKEGVFN